MSHGIARDIATSLTENEALPLYDLVERTPLGEAKKLSAKLGNRIFLKREDMQGVRSFKIRGAYKKLLSLSKKQRAYGVITASAGNHAQGLACAARHLGCAATIVMPVTTPTIKIKGVQEFDANVILHGDTFAEALSLAHQLRDAEGLEFIHPFDDLEVIKGQATIALELLAQRPAGMDYIFVPVGGGGLIAGIAAIIKHNSPNTVIVGVEPDDANCMQRAISLGQPSKLSSVGIFADGVAVDLAGSITYDICKDTIDHIITVNSDEICTAIKDVFEDSRALLEPSGALAIAGVKKFFANRNVENKSVVAICSGSNLNFDRLGYICERALLGDKQEKLFAAIITEQPGSLKNLCAKVKSLNITEFNYRRCLGDKAAVFIGLKKTNETQESAFFHEKNLNDIRVIDLSHDEVARAHVRHMIGGKLSHKRETIYRIAFPERPGAFHNFLACLEEPTAITLLHYRNHGAAQGDVIIGLESAANIEESFEQRMDQLGYIYDVVTTNESLSIFLDSVPYHDSHFSAVKSTSASLVF